MIRITNIDQIRSYAWTVLEVQFTTSSDSYIKIAGRRYSPQESNDLSTVQLAAATDIKVVTPSLTCAIRTPTPVRVKLPMHTFAAELISMCRMHATEFCTETSIAETNPTFSICWRPSRISRSTSGPVTRPNVTALVKAAGQIGEIVLSKGRNSWLKFELLKPRLVIRTMDGLVVADIRSPVPYFDFASVDELDEFLDQLFTTAADLLAKLVLTGGSHLSVKVKIETPTTSIKTLTTDTRTMEKTLEIKTAEDIALLPFTILSRARVATTILRVEIVEPFYGHATLLQTSSAPHNHEVSICGMDTVRVQTAAETFVLRPERDAHISAPLHEVAARLIKQFEAESLLGERTVHIGKMHFALREVNFAVAKPELSIETPVFRQSRGITEKKLTYETRLPPGAMFYGTEIKLVTRAGTATLSLTKGSDPTLPDNLHEFFSELELAVVSILHSLRATTKAAVCASSPVVKQEPVAKQEPISGDKYTTVLTNATPATLLTGTGIFTLGSTDPARLAWELDGREFPAAMPIRVNFGQKLRLVRRAAGERLDVTVHRRAEVPRTHLLPVLRAEQLMTPSERRDRDYCEAAPKLQAALIAQAEGEQPLHVAYSNDLGLLQDIIAQMEALGYVAAFDAELTADGHQAVSFVRRLTK